MYHGRKLRWVGEAKLHARAMHLASGTMHSNAAGGGGHTAQYIWRQRLCSSAPFTPYTRTKNSRSSGRVRSRPTMGQRQLQAVQQYSRSRARAKGLTRHAMHFQLVDMHHNTTQAASAPFPLPGRSWRRAAAAGAMPISTSLSPQQYVDLFTAVYDVYLYHILLGYYWGMYTTATTVCTGSCNQAQHDPPPTHTRVYGYVVRQSPHHGTTTGPQHRPWLRVRMAGGVRGWRRRLTHASAGRPQLLPPPSPPPPPPPAAGRYGRSAFARFFRERVCTKMVPAGGRVSGRW